MEKKPKTIGEKIRIALHSINVKRCAIWVSVAICLPSLVLLVVRFSEITEKIFGNSLLISGALLIGSGAVLNKRDRAWLTGLVAQEKHKKRIALTRVKLRESTVAQDIARYNRRIARLEALLDSKINSSFSQKDLATLIIDTSNTSFAGTTLIVLGTVFLVLTDLHITVEELGKLFQ